MKQPILSNWLYCPEKLPTKRQLKRFQLQWKEYVYEEVLDEEGLRVLTDAGNPKVKRRTVSHTLNSYRTLLTGGADWIGLPRGDKSLVADLAGDAVDLRSRNPLGFRLRLGSHVLQDKRWPDQKRCVLDWYREGSGLIVGQTGAGKTILGLAAACRCGFQTLIISKRGEGEKHWEREFREHTNIDELEEETGERLVGPYRDKGAAYPITIATVQTFLHKLGYRRLIRDQFRFGLIIADEVHELVAPEFIRLLSLWAPRHWLGLTATPERPDKRDFLAYQILGPIAAKLEADQLPPEVEFIEIPFSVPHWMMGRKPYSRRWTWTKLLSLVSTHEDSLKIMQDRIQQDIDDGRLVAVVGERTKMLRTLHDRVRREGYDVAYVDGKVPMGKRDQIYADMAEGKKYRCLFAGKVLDAMVSIKPLDCLHLITPVAAKHRIKQIFGRTRRTDEGKAIPLCRYYAGSGGQLSGAFRKVLKVCENEGWKIRRTSLALSARSTMGKWKPK